MPRRHDIDALRCLAFGLLILYHVGMFYVAGWDWHVKSLHQAAWLQWPMLFVNRWRLDLVFMVSGMAAAFLLKPDAIWRFVRQRHHRLMLPLLVGMAFVVPIQPYLQGLANGKLAPGFGTFLLDYWFHRHPWPVGAFSGWQYGVTWNHLWYLFYLWMYTSVLALLAKPLASPAGQKLRAWLTGLRGWKLMVLPGLPLLAYVVLLQDRFPENRNFVSDWYAHAFFFTVFLYGYLIARADGFWAEVVRLRRVSLGLALAIFTGYITLSRLLPDSAVYWQVVCIWILRVAYIWSMLLAILGWAHALLNRPWRWLPWANESVYPWYMLHQSLVVGLGFWLTAYRFGPVVEPMLVLAGTVGGCFLLTEAIQRVGWLRPCFGMKALPRQPVVRADAVLRDDCA